MNYDGLRSTFPQSLLAVTSGGAGTSTDTASVSSGGYRFALFVVSVDMSGSKTLTTVLQDSDDNVNFADVSGTTFSDYGSVAITTRSTLVRFEKVRPYVRMRLTRVLGTIAPSVTCVRFGEVNTDNVGGTIHLSNIP